MRALVHDSRKHLWFLLFITLIATTWVQWPRIRDPYSVEDDFRNYYWMHRFQDYELFENDDLLIDRIKEFHIGSWGVIFDGASPGYSSIFSIASRWIPFLLFSKLLIFPLTLVTVFYLYRVGDLLGSPKTGMVMALFFLVLDLSSPTSISTVAGLQRSFIFPLLAGLLYYLMVGRYRIAAYVIFISGVIYPPAFVIGVVTYSLTLLKIKRNGSWFIEVDWHNGLPLLITVGLTIVILIPTVTDIMDGEQIVNESLSQKLSEEGYTRVFSPANDGRHILDDPYYQEGNGGQLFDEFPFVGRGGVTLPGMSAIHLLLLGLIAFSIILLNPQAVNNLPLILKCFFVAIWICYFAAWLVILLTSTFFLYFPSRYTEAALLLFLIILIVINGKQAVQRLGILISENRKALMFLVLPPALLGIILFRQLGGLETSNGLELSPIRWLLGGLLILLIILVFLVGRSKQREREPRQMRPWLRYTVLAGMVLFIIIVAIGYIALFTPRYYHASTLERDLFQYLESLPKDAVLGGSMPDKRFTVSFFARRSIVQQCKDPNVDLRVAAAQTYFASVEQPQSIVAYCNQCGVDYLVVNESDFNEEALKAGRANVAGSYLEDVYDSLDDGREYALEHVPIESRLYQAGEFFILACDESLVDAVANEVVAQ